MEENPLWLPHAGIVRNDSIKLISPLFSFFISRSLKILILFPVSGISSKYPGSILIELLIERCFFDEFVTDEILRKTAI